MPTFHDEETEYLQQRHERINEIREIVALKLLGPGLRMAKAHRTV